MYYIILNKSLVVRTSNYQISNIHFHKGLKIYFPHKVIVEYHKLMQSSPLEEKAEEKMKKRLFELLLLLLKLYEDYPGKYLVFDLRNNGVWIHYLNEETGKWRKNDFGYMNTRFAILINSYLLLAKLDREGKKVKVDEFKKFVAGMDKLFYTKLLGEEYRLIYESEVNQLIKGRTWFRKCFDFEDEYVKPLYVPREIIFNGKRITPSDYFVREEDLNRLLEKIG